MKLHFDPNQQYQLDAIRSIVDVFEGQPLNDGDFSFSISHGDLLLQLGGVGNRLTISEEQMLENVRSVQEKNKLPLSDKLKGMNFSVEMETGTGKTYVYFKLPFRFKIKTPIGNYNPDWVLIKKNERTVYFVAETKSEGQELKSSEKIKIKCGQAHFEEFDNVKYKQVATVGELDD